MNTESNHRKQDKKPPHVVILGSGYAGIHACRELMRRRDNPDDLKITLISDVDHMLYVTMIYEVPAGNLAPSSIRQSVRSMIADENVHFKKGKATEINTEAETVHYEINDSLPVGEQKPKEFTMSYDYLVSAIGSETEFFGTPGAKEHAYRLKELKHAKDLKNTLINNFEKASLETDTQIIEELLTFVVVGGGPTGTTLAAKLANLLNDELADSFPDLIDHAQITVLEAQDTLVERAGLWFSNNVTEALTDMPRVSIKTDCCVERVRPDGVVYNDDEVLRSECVIWTAGVKAREIDFTNEAVKIDEHSRRVHVTPKLHLPEDSGVYVAGDQAWVERIDSKQPYPMRAQFAVRQGRQAAKNILADIRNQPKEDFYWNDKGIVISVGHGRTYAEVLGVKMSGLPATIAYKSTYLLSTIGVRNKFRALLEWFMNMFLPRDISEL